MKATGFAAVALVAAGSGVAQSFGRFTYGVLLPALRDELAISNSCLLYTSDAATTPYV